MHNPKRALLLLPLSFLFFSSAFAIMCWNGNQSPPAPGTTTGLTQSNCTALSSIYDRCSAYENDGIRSYTCDYATTGSGSGSGCNNAEFYLGLNIICCFSDLCNSATSQPPYPTPRFNPPVPPNPQPASTYQLTPTFVISLSSLVACLLKFNLNQ